MDILTDCQVRSMLLDHILVIQLSSICGVRLSNKPLLILAWQELLDLRTGALDSLRCYYDRHVSSASCLPSGGMFFKSTILHTCMLSNDYEVCCAVGSGRRPSEGSKPSTSFNLHKLRALAEADSNSLQFHNLPLKRVEARNGRHNLYNPKRPRASWLLQEDRGP